MKRGGPLNQRSEKRIREDREREKAKAVVRQRARGGCEAARAIASVDPDEAGCWGPFDCHEVLSRARGGSITDPAGMIQSCRRHHDWIGTHQALIDEGGLDLLQHSWTAPAKKPILYTGLRAVNVVPRAEPRPKATSHAPGPESAASSQPGTITLSFAHPERPWTVNGERKWTPYRRAEVVKHWRESFAILARGSVKLEWADVVVKAYLRDMRGQDVGGCLPAAKAAVDGIRDAKVLPDDDPRYVRSLTFLAPEKMTYDALEIILTGPKA